MSVYVDPVMEHGGSKTFKWTRSCHMYADSPEELHAMALRIGMRRAWFQPDEGRLPHYDLVPARRKAAVEAGALEHTREQMVQFMRSRNGLAAGQTSLFGGK
jgi:glycine/D-amino acid oxidase-like deaminating enzyme